MIILDGLEVDDTTLDRTKHTYIGSFRPAHPPEPTLDCKWEVFVCSCKLHLWTHNEVQDHWMRGHLDIPQYKTIKYE